MSTLLTEQALAARWDITTRTLRALKARNEAPPVCEVIGKPRYRLEDVMAHEEAATKGGFIPPEARRAIARAAQTLDLVAGWKSAGTARAQLTAQRDELLALIGGKP